MTPRSGIIPPKGEIMIRVCFAPQKDGPVTCVLKIRTNAAAPPGAGSSGS